MLKMNHASLHKIKVHARQTYPEECCGFLLGTTDHAGKTICDILEVNNTRQDNRQRRFLINPDDYKVAEMFARKEGVELLGLYHSHPNHPARPSQYDLDHALPFWSYVIVSVQEGEPGDTLCWLLKEDRSSFLEEELCVWQDHETYATNHPTKQ
jgi:proteasome lid subunit RPN8/RPN11